MGIINLRNTKTELKVAIENDNNNNIIKKAIKNNAIMKETLVPRLLVLHNPHFILNNVHKDMANADFLEALEIQN